MRIGLGSKLNVSKIGERGTNFQRSESPITGYESAFTIYKGFMRNNLPHGDDSFVDEEERERERH